MTIVGTILETHLRLSCAITSLLEMMTILWIPWQRSNLSWGAPQRHNLVSGDIYTLLVHRDVNLHHFVIVGRLLHETVHCSISVIT